VSSVTPLLPFPSSFATPEIWIKAIYAQRKKQRTLTVRDTKQVHQTLIKQRIQKRNMEFKNHTSYRIHRLLKPHRPLQDIHGMFIDNVYTCHPETLAGHTTMIFKQWLSSTTPPPVPHDQFLQNDLTDLPPPHGINGTSSSNHPLDWITPNS
jgi:hypothetical protein